MIPPEPFRRAEGYLDLGMYAEANAALEEVAVDLHMTEHWMRLRERALTEIGDVEGARVIRLLIDGLPKNP